VSIHQYQQPWTEEPDLQIGSDTVLATVVSGQTGTKSFHIKARDNSPYSHGGGYSITLLDGSREEAEVWAKSLPPDYEVTITEL